MNEMPVSSGILLDIRMVGVEIAIEEGIFHPKKTAVEIPFASDVVEDFVARVVDDLLTFATITQYADTLELFTQPFVYVYGKGAEFAFSARNGVMLERISYDFDKAMQGQCAERLPDHLQERMSENWSNLRYMFACMYVHAVRFQDQMLAERVTLCECLQVMLSGAFYYGRQFCLTLPARDIIGCTWQEPEDRPYDDDTYDDRYKPEDYDL